VDVHHLALDKEKIYAALGVPELWRVRDRTVQIRVLKGGRYRAARRSAAFAVLTTAVLNQYLAMRLDSGEHAAVTAFREWLRSRSL
jgi:DNA gyrase inhibitor GyrI